jgi:hypothetical protein
MHITERRLRQIIREELGQETPGSSVESAFKNGIMRAARLLPDLMGKNLSFRFEIVDRARSDEFSNRPDTVVVDLTTTKGAPSSGVLVVTGTNMKQSGLSAFDYADKSILGSQIRSALYANPATIANLFRLSAPVTFSVSTSSSSQQAGSTITPTPTYTKVAGEALSDIIANFYGLSENEIDGDLLSLFMKKYISPPVTSSVLPPGAKIKLPGEVRLSSGKILKRVKDVE